MVLTNSITAGIKMEDQGWLSPEGYSAMAAIASTIVALISLFAALASNAGAKATQQASEKLLVSDRRRELLSYIVTRLAQIRSENLDTVSRWSSLHDQLKEIDDETTRTELNNLIVSSADSHSANMQRQLKKAEVDFHKSYSNTEMTLSELDELLIKERLAGQDVQHAITLARSVYDQHHATILRTISERMP